MKKPSLVLLITLLTGLALHADEPEPTSIFNGKDLTGWTASDQASCWIVEDGILKVRSNEEKKGSILWTEKEYTDFVVDFEFRFIEGTIDSGIFMRKDHDQIQIGISGSLKRDMTGSPYIPKKGYPKEAEGVAELLKMDDWNHMKIQAVGPTYTIWLNGKKVNTYTSETAVETGPIGIQLHPGRDMAIDYRNIQAAEIE